MTIFDWIVLAIIICFFLILILIGWVLYAIDYVDTHPPGDFDEGGKYDS
jgi:hypothetical protein